MEMAHCPHLGRGQRVRGCMVGAGRGQGWGGAGPPPMWRLGTRAHTQLHFVTVTPPAVGHSWWQRDPPPADKWSLVQFPLRNLEARTVDDSVSLKRAHMPCFQASVFSVSLLASPA